MDSTVSEWMKPCYVHLYVQPIVDIFLPADTKILHYESQESVFEVTFYFENVLLPILF